MSDTTTIPEPPPPALRRIAYHEAGHVVAALAFGHAVKRVVIDPQTPAGATPGQRPPHRVEWTDALAAFDTELLKAEARAVYAFAGDAAELHLLGGRPEGEVFQHGPDYSVAFGAAAPLFAENRDRHVFLDRMEDRARSFVREPVRWRQIRAVAEALLERHELTGDEAAEILDLAAR